jgi:hypothetical protein
MAVISTHHMQTGDHGQRYHGGQQPIKPVYRQPGNGRELGIEAHELERFPEHCHPHQSQSGQRHHRVEIRAGGRRRLTEQETVEPGLGGAAPTLDPGQQHHAEGKPEAECCGERCIHLQPRVTGQRYHQQRRSHAGHQCTGHDRCHVAGTRHHEAETHTGQRRMREGIAEQTLPAEHGEGTQNATDHTDQCGTDHDVLQRVIGERVEHRYPGSGVAALWPGFSSSSATCPP